MAVKPTARIAQPAWLRDAEDFDPRLWTALEAPAETNLAGECRFERREQVKI